jgi:Periplasmic copper-binding protein (NosD)
MRTLFLLFSATLLPLVAHPAMAGPNVAVGTCKPQLTSFSTIQAAVSAVHAGSIVFVCPGVYPEQVTITQPLFLQGVADSNLDQAVITVPSSGLATNVTSIFGEAVAAQVLVQNTGPVNITNIIVDGTGGDQACATTGTWLAGIFYASNSSGDVNRVRTSGQIDGTCGVGIWAENGGTTNQSITIEGSSVHDVDGAGISVASGTPPTLNVVVKNNYVSSQIGIGIFAMSVNGDIRDNDVSDSMAGLLDWAAGARVSQNNITSVTFGVVLLAGGTVQSNNITNSSYGAYLEADGATVQYNRITLAATAGVQFNCSAGTVVHNTINDAAIGFSNVPAGFSGSNTFANTGTISTFGCVAATAGLGSRRAAPQPGGASRLAKPSSFSRWRTPANPRGSRP